MRNNKQQVTREPITIHISNDALSILVNMNANLAYRVKKKRSVSFGKIIEILLLKEDAQVYVEKKLLS